MSENRCRFCDAEIKDTFVDLGMAPLSNSYVKHEDLQKKENYYPLHAYVCKDCFLVQLEEFESPEQIFSEYAYFSSCSKSWLKHAEQYTRMMIQRFNLDKTAKIVEIASNDGYLLSYFKEAGFEVLGVEPAENIAKVSRQKGIDTVSEFFGLKTAMSFLSNGCRADVLIANNVLAHVPNINDFVAGIKVLLSPEGIITIEFPHVLKLIEGYQFDTIYHEHFSYLSLITTSEIFEKHGLKIFDVEEISTHGGSLRVFGKHIENTSIPVSDAVISHIEKEKRGGLNQISTYTSFSKKVEEKKREILKKLIEIKECRQTIVGYGAPAKGNTLINYCGVSTDFMEYTVDISSYKQGMYLPGSRIPIYTPTKIMETKPDYVVILPWNIKDEIIEDMACVKEWGGKFLILIPEIEVI